jgi:hypothetical protein
MRSLLVLLLGIGIPLQVGCQGRTTHVEPDDPTMGALVDAVLPRQIEIQNFTQPVSLRGDGEPDTLEVVVSASDASGDPTKAVGTFQFELYEFQMASALRTGNRISYWRKDVHSDDSLREYWDGFSRYFRFPLELTPLPRGEYVLLARYTDPTGRHLFDEHLIALTGDPVPPGN